MAPLLRAAIAAILFATTASAATVTGTVIAADTRLPLRSMVVAAYDASGSLRGTATTDATGLYALSLPSGSYRILAYDLTGVYATAFDGNAESFETSPFVTVTASATVDFALVPGGSVTGTVYDPNGAPRGNAVVAAYNLSGTRRGFTTTNTQGQYSIVLPPGEYKIVAFDDTGSFAASFFRDARDFEAATPVAVAAARATAGIDFRLTIAARVLGTVIDAATQAPLANVLVYAYSESGSLVQIAPSDANGVFRMSLPAGRYRFVAGDPGRVFAPGATGFVALVAGQLHSTIQLPLLRGGVLMGRVTNASGAPLANITIAAYDANGIQVTTVTTDANGAYELVVAPGTVYLAAFDPALQFTTAVLAQPTTVVAGQRVGGFDFTLTRGGQISGVVRDAVTSQPLARMTVAAYTVDGTLLAQTSTDTLGRFALVVPPGEVRLVAFDPLGKYTPRFDNNAPTFDTSTPRAIAMGGSITADFTLLKKGPKRRSAGH